MTPQMELPDEAAHQGTDTHDWREEDETWQKTGHWRFLEVRERRAAATALVLIVGS